MKILAALLVTGLPLVAVADVVVPADSVENYVNIRKAPEASAEVVGRLGQGDSFALVSTTDGWYEVQLDAESTGFVSADWADVRSTDEETRPGELAEEVAAEVTAEIDEEVAAELPDEAALDVEEEQTTEVVNAELPDESGDVREAVVTDVVEEFDVAEGIDANDDVDATVVTETATVSVAAEAPTAAANLEGDVNFLVKFRRETEGGNSQVYDDGNRVGIGTTEPGQRLDVNGSLQIHDRNSSLAGLIITQSAGDSGYIMHNRAGTLTIGAGSQDRITIDRDGNVGIAVAKPEHPLEMASGAHVTAGGVWTNRSSRASKQDIASLSEADAAAALMQLEPVTFRYIDESGENYVGFIAEDVPELVANSDRSSLSPMDIVAVLTKVVQAQQRRIEELEARLEAGLVE